MELLDGVHVLITLQQWTRKEGLDSFMCTVVCGTVERVERSGSISTAYGRQAGRNSFSGLYQASILLTVTLVRCSLSVVPSV